jgi:effector-binding domain-containing protein
MAIIKKNIQHLASYNAITTYYEEKLKKINVAGAELDMNKREVDVIETNTKRNNSCLEACQSRTNKTLLLSSLL